MKPTPGLHYTYLNKPAAEGVKGGREGRAERKGPNTKFFQ